MNNLEVAEAATLRMKARIAVRGLGLPPKVKEAIMAAIEAARLPLYKYFKVSKPDTAQAFVNKVIAGIGDIVDIKIKERVKICLKQNLT